MKLPGETQRSQAVVSSKIAPRSCKVEVNGRFYRYNRKQLCSTKEPLQQSPSENGRRWPNDFKQSAETDPALFS